MILIGFKGVGKTYFGMRLAKKLGVSFIDTDQLLEQLFAQEYQKNLTCSAIALEKGFHFFRQIEKKVIHSLEKKENLIIALGGGSVLDEDNRHYLRSLGKLVYLETSIEILKKRIFQQETSPVFLNAHDGSFERIYYERQAIYEKIASVKIHIAGKSEDEILALLQTEFFAEF